MANVKVTELTALAAADSASTDVLPVVDVSADATKKLAISDLHRSVPDGTLSAPGIAFQSDLNSGLYRSGTDAIALVTNGAARILIDATGNVTIPNDLTVQGATTFITGQTVLIEDKNIELGVVTTPTDVTADGGGITLKGATDKTIQWINSTGAWTFNQPVNVTGGEDILIKVESTDRYAHIELADNAATSRITTDGNTGTLRLRADTSNAVASSAIQLEIDGDTKMFINSSGDVLIGKTTTALTTVGTRISSGFISAAASSSSTNLGANAGGAISLANTGSTDNNFSNIGGYNSNGLVVNQINFINTSHSSRTGEIGFSTHDGSSLTERIRIDNSGNVGIGTTSPTSIYGTNLNINDASSSALHLTTDNSGTSNFDGFHIINSSGIAYLWNRENTATVFATNNTERMRIDSSGRVLIGAISGTELLEVHGDTPVLKLRDTSDYVAGTGPQIYFQGKDSNEVVKNFAIIRGQADGADNGELTFWTRLNGSSVERLRIEKNGNVGIGETSAEAKLHVKEGDSGVTPDANRNTLFLEADGNAGLTIGTPNTNSCYLTFGDPEDENAGQIIYRHANDSMSAFIAGQERLHIDSSGNVGIGTTNPLRSLHVAGSGDTGLMLQTTNAVDDNEIWEIQAAGNASNYADLIFRTRTNAGTGGSEAIRITSDGNLGVGTSSPTSYANSQATLVIEDNTNPAICWSDTGQAKDWWAVANGSNLSFNYADGGGSGSASNVTNVLSMASSGSVGIGTTSPGRQLQINGDSDTQIRVVASAGGAAGIQFGDANDSVMGGVNFDASDDSLQLRGFNNTERMRIDSSGTVLFGGESTAEDDHANINANGTLTVRRASATDDAIIVKEGSTTSFLVEADGRCQNFNVGNLAFLAYDTESTGATDSAYAAMGSISGEARITAGHSGSGNTPLVFRTASGGTEAEVARFSSDGYLKASNDGSYASSVLYHEFRQTDNEQALIGSATHASYSENLFIGRCTRAATSVYNFVTLQSSAGADSEFILRGDGNGYADGSWNGGGADYAEFFEWLDSNSSKEDRRGISVVLEGDKIREAVDGEEPIGVISGNPSVVGDADTGRWKGKYLRDEFNTYIQEDYTVQGEDGNIITQQQRKLNPDYDSELEYVKREDRPEWDCVGLMGKIRIRKGQVTGARWIKMKDINDSVEEWLVR